MHLGITTLEVVLRTALPAAAVTVLVGKPDLDPLPFRTLEPKRTSCRACPRTTQLTQPSHNCGLLHHTTRH